MKIYPNLFSATCLLAVLLAPLAQAQSTCTPEHAAMGHCTMDVPKVEVAKPEASPKPAKSESKPDSKPEVKASSACTAEHAAMGHCIMDEPKADKPKKNSKLGKVKKSKKKAVTAEKSAVSEPKPMAQVSTTCTPEHAAMGHCTLDTPKPAIAKPNRPVSVTTKPAPKLLSQQKPASTCRPEHAAMGHCTMPRPKAAPQAKPAVKPSAPTAGVCTPEHAAMGHCTLDAPKTAVPVLAKSSSTCLPEHAAMGHCTLDSDLPVSDGSAATNIPMPYHQAMDMNDDPFLSKVMIDRFEVRKGDHGNPVILEADAWFGKSVDKLWLKTDIEAVEGDLEEAQLQVLYNRAISPFWDVQAGIRHDFKPVKRTWAALGVQGTAPYFIETDATLFLGKSGQTALTLSAEKEVMLTQKTVLIPEVAMTIYGKDDHELGVGSGVADLNLGLRLSHEFRREFAPYIGVNWSKKLGKTADLAKEHGDKTQNTEFLLGIQAWF